MAEIKRKIKKRSEIGEGYCFFWGTIALLVNILQIVFLSIFPEVYRLAPEESSATMFLTTIVILNIGLIRVNIFIKKHHPELRN